MPRFITRGRFIKLSVILVVLIAAIQSVSGCAGESETRTVDNGNSQEGPRFDWPAETVELKTDDGVTIIGTYVLVETFAGSHPAVVLCHQRNKDRRSWAGFQNLLANNGICSLAIDFRGFGDSTGDGLDFKKFKNQDYTNMVNDIDAALKYLTENPAKTQVNTDQIGIIGASIGANLSIIASAELDGFIFAVSLSPGRDYFGLKPLDYSPDVDIPVMIAYTQGDEAPAGVISDLIDSFGENKPDVRILNGLDHGTDMFALGFDMELLDWIKERIGN